MGCARIISKLDAKEYVYTTIAMQTKASDNRPVLLQLKLGLLWPLDVDSASRLVVRPKTQWNDYLWSVRVLLLLLYFSTLRQRIQVSESGKELDRD